MDRLPPTDIADLRDWFTRQAATVNVDRTDRAVSTNRGVGGSGWRGGVTAERRTRHRKVTGSSCGRELAVAGSYIYKLTHYYSYKLLSDTGGSRLSWGHLGGVEPLLMGAAMIHWFYVLNRISGS